MTLSITVFEAFPAGIIRGRYSIGAYQRGTIVGAEFVSYGNLDVIVDEGDASDISYSPNAAEIKADIIMYAMPEQLPTVNPRALTSGYLIYDSQEDDYFAITTANLAKNQNTGELEHVELSLVQTEVTNG